jgi:hypothetical protein
MQLKTSVTTAEFKQGISLNRDRGYWFRQFLHNWYAVVLLVVIICAEIAAMANGKFRPDALPYLLIPVLFLWWSWYRIHRAMEKGARQISDLKGSASFDSDGIRSTNSTGATSFVPWVNVSSWKEGPDVFTLLVGKSLQVFPKRGLGSAKVDEVRSLLKANVR